MGPQEINFSKNNIDKLQIELLNNDGTPYESHQLNHNISLVVTYFQAHGVVLVYNPEQEGQVSESGAWYEYFVQNNDLPDEACVVFAFAPNAQRGTRQRVSPKIEHLNVVNISLDDGSLVKTQFERFLKAAKARKDAGGGGGEAKGAEYK